MPGIRAISHRCLGSASSDVCEDKPRSTFSRKKKPAGGTLFSMLSSYGSTCTLALFSLRSGWTALKEETDRGQAAHLFNLLGWLDNVRSLSGYQEAPLGTELDKHGPHPFGLQFPSSIHSFRHCARLPPCTPCVQEYSPSHDAPKTRASYPRGPPFHAGVPLVQP